MLFGNIKHITRIVLYGLLLAGGRAVGPRHKPGLKLLINT